jgi:hypothetical protein
MRFVVLATEELERLERFQRAARAHGIESAPQDYSPREKTEFYQSHLNARIYHGAPDWMLPSWALLSLRARQGDKADDESLPNNSYRNWSLLGGPVANYTGFSDSRGLVTANAECGSIDVWVAGEEHIVFPALLDKDGSSLRLISPEDQVYEWKIDVGPVAFTKLVYHVKREGGEYIYNEIVLRNLGLEEAHGKFYVTIRPMSPMGFEPLESIEYRQGRVIVNSRTALAFKASPSAVILGRANDEDLMRKVRTGEGRFDGSIRDLEGLGIAVLCFDVRLGPAGSKRYFFSSPLGEEQSTFQGVVTEPSSTDRDSHVESWFSFSEEHASATFPDEVLDATFKQSVASLAMRVSSLFTSPDTEPNLAMWVNRARVLRALARAGCVSVIEGLLRRLVSAGEADSLTSAPILCALLEIDALDVAGSQSSSLRQFVSSEVECLVEDLSAVETGVPAEGAAPRAGDDIEDPLQHYFLLDSEDISDIESDLWLLTAIETARSATRRWGMNLGAKNIEDVVSSLKARIDEKTDRVAKARWPRPNDAVMDVIDLEILGLLAAMSSISVSFGDSKFLQRIVAAIEERRVVKGLWRTSSTADLPSSHLLLRLAQFYCFARQRGKAEKALNRCLEFLSHDFLLPEYVNTRTFGGRAGNGSSVIAAADLVLLLRDMLLHEEEDSLTLLPGIPSEWFTSKRPLVLERLPTRFGSTALEIGMSANQHQVEVGAPNLPGEIVVHVPSSVPISMVKGYGASIVERHSKSSSPHLQVVPLTDKIVLTFHK